VVSDGLWGSEQSWLHTFVDEYQAQVVSGRVLLVDLAECGCEVKAAEEQPDGDRLSWYLISEFTRLRAGAAYLAMVSRP
jgi:hypothetical protein